MIKKGEKEEYSWNQLTQIEDKYHDYEYPKVSIVIPTYQSEEKIAITIDSVLIQDYPDLEIIIVDAGSTDRTLEVIKNYRDDRITLYSVSEYHRYEMLNKGISQSMGLYINFLFPGDFYIHRETLRFMMSLALDHDQPHMVYCGTLIRDGRKEAKILFRKLSLANLRKGLQPTSLQSCWFRSDTFKKIGKFNRKYALRGGFDLMCRFCLDETLRFADTNRVHTDYDLRLVTRRMVTSHCVETLKTIYHYFGTLTTLKWLVTQKDTFRYLKLWLRNVKIAFLGRR